MQGAIAASAALPFTPVIRPWAEPSIRVGIITEPGGAHLSLYLKSLANCQGGDQIALADSTGGTFENAKSVLASRFHKLRTFRDSFEMVSLFKPDLVLVTLETHHMPPALRMALESNCHVLSEKHPCVTIDDLDAVVRLADARQRHFMLAFATRFSPIVQKAKEVVQSGLIGKPYGTSAYLIADRARFKRPGYSSSWLALKQKAGGGFLMQVGIHYLDLVQHISGDKVRKVAGFCRNVGGHPIEVEDTAVAALEFEKGMVGTLQSGCYLESGYQSHFTLWGSQGWLRFGLVAGTPLEWVSTVAGSSGIQSFSDSTSYLSNEYFPIVQSAINAARGLEEPPVTSAEGLHVLKVLFAIYQASQSSTAQAIT